MQKYDTIYFYSKFRKKQITYNGNISLKIQRGKNTRLYKSITDKKKITTPENLLQKKQKFNG